MGKIEKLQEIVDNSKYIVALTGAGISTAAGIADFRGEKGIYTRRAYDPYKTFDLSYFKKDPSFFFKFAREYVEIYRNTKPTKAHYFLSALEKKGNLKVIITQNIDRLHQLAGSKNVIELHGSFDRGYCLKCGRTYDLKWIMENLKKNGELKCICGGIVKPDIVFFGEPVKEMDRAEEYARNADLFLVIGSSLSVQPAGLLPYITSGKVVIINKGDVEFPGGKVYLRIDDNIEKTVESLKW